MKVHHLVLVLFCFSVIVYALDHMTPLSSTITSTRHESFIDSPPPKQEETEKTPPSKIRTPQKKKIIRQLHTHTSPIFNRQIVIDRTAVRQRSEFIALKSFAPSNAGPNPHPDHFIGMSFMIDASATAEADGAEKSEIIKNERGYADVDWNVTFDCLKSVHERFFKTSDPDFDKLIPFNKERVMCEFVSANLAQQQQQKQAALPTENEDEQNTQSNAGRLLLLQPRPSLSYLFHGLVKENLGHLASLNDYGVRMRALGFCLKGGGVGINRIISQGEWEQRGGTDMYLVHPSILAMHGGVSPLRALVQGMRSGQYLISNSPVTEEFLMVRNDPATFAPTVKLLSLSLTSSKEESGSADVDSSTAEIQSLYTSTMFSPLILSSSSVLDGKASKLDEKLVNLHYIFAKTTQLQQDRIDEILEDVNENDVISDEPFVIVDLGTGHASLLNAMCPMSSHIWCYGVDFAPRLLEQGSYFFPHLDLRSGVSAPHIPTGTADAVFSNGVMGIIKYLQNCGHLREIIRLMRPGRGVAQIWHPATYLFNRFHPSWFVEDEETFLHHANENEQIHKASFMPDWETNEILINLTEDRVSHIRRAEKRYLDEQQKLTSSSSSSTAENENPTSSSSTQKHAAFVHFTKVLKRCPGNLGKFLSRVDIIGDDPHIPIFTPTWAKRFLQPCATCQGGAFGIRLFRNDVVYGDFDKETLIFEPEKLPDETLFTFEPPSNLATTLKAPPGLVDCLSTAERWRKCSELDAFTVQKVFDCGDRMVKGYVGKKKYRAWCPDVHTQMIEKIQKFRKDIRVLQPGKEGASEAAGDVPIEKNN